MFSEFAWKKNFAPGNGEEGGMLEPPTLPLFFCKPGFLFLRVSLIFSKQKKKMEKYPTCYVQYIRYFGQTFPFATCLALEERPQEMQFFKKSTLQNQQR